MSLHAQAAKITRRNKLTLIKHNSTNTDANVHICNTAIVYVLDSSLRHMTICLT